MTLITSPNRNLFFTGKGGVGKTSMACATAVQLAESGQRVLLVSTDPASNLHDVLSTEIGTAPTSIRGVANLSAMNIDPAESAREYRERMVGPYRGVLPDSAIASMEEQFSGSCTVEIAAFDEFSRLLADQSATEEFDHVVFDTAPTGHTLRLLTLPSAWSGFMETSSTGTSCLGPLAGLQAQQELYRKSVESLADGELTTLILVSRPEEAALREASRTSEELQHLGIRNQQLIVNGIFTAQSTDDDIAAAMEARCADALAGIPESLSELPRISVPLLPVSVLGVERLKQIGKPDSSQSDETNRVVIPDLPVGLDSLIDDIADSGHGVVMTMGKGGVGKTTVAASVAVALADRGFEVLLSTTDPAAHVAATVASDGLPNLTVTRIDPAEETRQYRAEVISTAGEGLDDDGMALLEEDLRSPCTEEIAVFRAFARSVAEGRDRFVVLDTAPTGHTILLLDSALAYHREVSRQLAQMPEYVEHLLPRLRDPQFARVLVVTLPEATPVHEATQLQLDLQRAEIEPYAWVVNQSLQPLSVSDAVLRQRQANEAPFLREVRDTLSQRMAVLPWQKEPPTGVEGLRKIAHQPANAT